MGSWPGGDRVRAAPRGVSVAVLRLNLSLGVGRFIMNLSLLSLLPALVNAVRVKCSGAVGGLRGAHSWGVKPQLWYRECCCELLVP